MKQRTNRTGGFTIIEVVLVLAVAGLIFLVVFAAIPRLQASRRDNQRKRDAEAIWALAIEYQSNSGELLPKATAVDAFLNESGAFYDYIDDANLELDPSGNEYRVVDGVVGSNLALGTFNFTGGWLCNDSGTALLNTGSTQTRGMIMALERGSFCIDSS